MIAVAGPPGAGKSTLCQALAARLPAAGVLSMDSYQRMTEWPIEAVQRWADAGADHELLPMPLLADHLAQLQQGRPVVDPVSGQILGPWRHVVFETHLGRAHLGTGPMIDWLVWLDTSPDIALARNVRGYLRPCLQPGVAGLVGELHWIDAYLANYARLVGGLVAVQAARVRPGADQAVRGDLSPTEAAQAVLVALAAR